MGAYVSPSWTLTLSDDGIAVGQNGRYTVVEPRRPLRFVLASFSGS